MEKARRRADRQPARLYLVLSGLASLVMWVVAIPIGIYSATHQYSWGDVGLTTLGFLGLSVPDFMLGLIYLFVGVFVFHAPVGGLSRRSWKTRPGPRPKCSTWPITCSGRR